jgi:PAS domain S-box-containing protein
LRKKDGSFIWVRDIVTVVMEQDKPARLRGVMLDISAAKKAEAALLEYQKAIECSADMVSVIDRDYRYLVANRAFLDYLQLERADLIGQPLERILGSEQFLELKPYLDQCLSGRAVSFEQRVPSGADRFRELSVTYSPVEDSGVVSSVACVARNTTESKRAEQALRESEERYRRISNAVTDYIYTVRVGEDRKPRTWHGAGCLAVTGYREEEFAADEFLWLRMVADQDRDAVQSHALRLLNGSETEAIEHRIIRKDGQERWVRNTPVLRLDAQGRLREYEGLVQDITDRRAAEEAMRLSEQRFRGLLENIHLVSMILDPNGKVTFCNDFLLQITGWSRQETIGADWFEQFIPQQTRAEIREVFQGGLARGEIPAHYENPIVTKAGAYRSIIWDNTVLHHSDGSLAGIASIGMDMTQHRALEEQLRQSQKMEATGLLAGGIAHDFNNILTVIIGYCSIMQMRMAPDDPNHASVGHVLTAAERAAGLTRSLLAFSRKQVMNPEQVDLNAIVRHVEHFLCRVIGEDITLQADLYGEGLFILADSGQIEQIMMNLATNARDAMPDGGMLRVATRLATLDATVVGDGGTGEQYALFTFSDNGAGMDEETRLKIFEPFFTTKEVGKGTGLGLAMAYGIVKQHNGHIMVESEPGAGTTFKVYLPLVPYQEPEAKPEPQVLQPQTGHELILVAEDEPAVRELVAGILTGFGYRVLLACDGEEAVAVFREHQNEIKLVLMDVIMPRMSGKAACDQISLQKPDIKVIFTSGYTADAIRSKGDLGPGVELVLKPVQPLFLLRKVREVLDG